MKSFFRYFAIITFCFFFTKISAQDLPLIPYPQKVEIKTGNLNFEKTLRLMLIKTLLKLNLLKLSRKRIWVKSYYLSKIF
jgi:hypothetical protein